MQALELESFRATAPCEDRGRRHGVVRRELRKEHRLLEKLRCAGEIIGVGHRLAREDGIVGKPPLLRALDLEVPIGALDEPQHQAPAKRLTPACDMLDDRLRAFLIGLHGDAESFPAVQRGVGDDARNDLE